MTKQLELKTGRVVDLDGHVDARGIRYIGNATEFVSGMWRVLADVAGALCVVEVRLDLSGTAPSGDDA